MATSTFTPIKGYQTFVDQIRDFPWKKAEPFKIILLSLASAQEFAESLTLACAIHPKDEKLRLMADGELDTDNLFYRGYRERGDHWQFLQHFVMQFPTWRDRMMDEGMQHAIAAYTSIVSTMSPEHRAQTIFSREKELPGIFEEILAAHDWDALGFGFYRYYLERHIELDSGEGGHGELTEGHELDQDVLLHFYTNRYLFYKVGLLTKE